ncbi:MAG TPA: hypothetical protein VGL87_01465 [Steroidobacteraceae bacterium]
MSDPLETLVRRALQEAPLRRAPPSLEPRVLRELGRRAALPWWRHSFARWPRLARAGFTVTCGSVVAAVLAATWPWASGGASAGAGAWAGGSPLRLPWARSALTLVEVARELDAALVRVVPLEWLYGALAAGVILYAALFGLGAAAYRTLYLNSSSAGDRS